MTNQKIFQVDAFTNELFKGNPAAVCPLEKWLPGDLLQKIAMENNLSETAFFVAKGDEYELRWFTPKAEIKLCGHATLASAFVLFELFNSTREELSFKTLSGTLTVIKSEHGYTMNFPADVFNATDVTEEMTSAIGQKPEFAFYGNDILMLVLPSEKNLKQLIPVPDKIVKLHKHGLIVTSPGDESDFSSRCFFPHYGINEDPVTGSAHTILTPYWSSRLNKKSLRARQLSERTGDLWCTLKDDRVEISGNAVLYLEGTIRV